MVWEKKWREDPDPYMIYLVTVCRTRYKQQKEPKVDSIVRTGCYLYKFCEARTKGRAII